MRSRGPTHAGGGPRSPWRAQSCRGRPALAELLTADVPEDWPPATLVDALPWFVAQLEDHPTAIGWYGWYALLHGEAGRPVLVGSVGFKGPPDESGSAEIGYSVLPRFQRRGLATEMVGLLVDWAWRQPALARICAETTPDNIPSIRILSRCGFVSCGPGSEPGGVMYELDQAGDDRCGNARVAFFVHERHVSRYAPSPGTRCEGSIDSWIHCSMIWLRLATSLTMMARSRGAPGAVLDHAAEDCLGLESEFLEHAHGALIVFDDMGLEASRDSVPRPVRRVRGSTGRRAPGRDRRAR